MLLFVTALTIEAVPFSQALIGELTSTALAVG